MIAAIKGFIKWAGLILAVSVPMVSTQAHAVTVTVGGTSYELSSFTGSYNVYSSTLQSQDWWGKETLAVQLANALFVNGSYPSGYSMFAFNVSPNGRDLFAAFTLRSSGTSTGVGVLNLDNSYNFVTATSVPEINAGSLSQALLILFALWLVTRRRTVSRAT